jgi:uncharacterized protein
MKTPIFLSSLLICASLSSVQAQQNPAGFALPKTAVVSDKTTPLLPSEMKFTGGFLGTRYDANAKNRLLVVDENDLLDCFERRNVPHQDWQGEHAGKFLHAASLTWANTRSPALKAKLDRVVTRLLATQEADGYLGTYAPANRWKSWDVWVHKYDLLGLLTYYQQTQLTPDKADDALGKQALEACKRIGDLLIKTFGDAPDQRDINKSGEHVGMAPDSVLEPMVLLYRATKTPRYLDFARYIVRHYDAPGGPRVLSALKETGSVRKVANAKAYEMLSNFNGILELYRVTGEKHLLDTVLIGWKDIVENRLYPTGSASSFEHFQDNGNLPDGQSSNICETCVTVTWEQLNLQLLRLTGEARFAQELERSAYNHLTAAQKPTGEAWSYYTPLRGQKPYGSQTNCCLSSGPRGIALLPTLASTTAGDAIMIHLYQSGTATIKLANGAVKITQESSFPLAGKIVLTVEPEKKGQVFSLTLRETEGLKMPVGWQSRAGYASQRKAWKFGEKISLEYMPPVHLLDNPADHSRIGVRYGTLVLALGGAHNPAIRNLRNAALATDERDKLEITPAPEKSIAGEPVFQTAGRVGNADVPLFLTPYAFAGQDGKSRFTVWMKRPGAANDPNASLFSGAESSRSRQGNVSGDIADDDPETFVVTFDGKQAAEDWYAAALEKPISIRQVTFAHGRSFHDGGWFDASAGKPKIQVQTQAGGEWQTVAELTDYPATTATNNAGLKDGQIFRVNFPAVSAIAIRIIGKPAHGDNPKQAFSSCAELQAH